MSVLATKKKEMKKGKKKIVMPKALGASCIEPIIHTCLATANGSVTANLPQIGPSSNDKHLLTLI